MSVTTANRLRTAAVKPALAARPKAVAPARSRRSAWLERGDWLAVPLCILWGIGLWAWPFSGLLTGLAMPGNPLSSIGEWPMTMARYLFGW